VYLPAEQIGLDVVGVVLGRGRVLREEEELLEHELNVDVDDVDVLAQLHRLLQFLIRGQDICVTLSP
jgi:hypothetical protein